jgi:hypothetical protein
MFENAPTEIPTNAWLLVDALGRSMSDTRLWSGNRDAPEIGCLPNLNWTRLELTRSHRGDSLSFSHSA